MAVRVLRGPIGVLLALAAATALVFGAATRLLPQPDRTAPPLTTTTTRIAGVAFEHPADWTVAGDVVGQGPETLAIVGTQAIDASCTRGPIAVDRWCAVGAPLDAGRLRVELQFVELEQVTLLEVAPTTARTTPTQVAGLPAVRAEFEPRAGGPDLEVEWLVARPAGLEHVLRIAAAARDPDSWRARAAVEALVASVVFEGVEPTPRALAVEEVAREVLAELRERSLATEPAAPADAVSIYDCFADSLGPGRITATAGPGGPLPAPVEVACRGRIEPEGGVFHRVDLEFTFDGDGPGTDGTYRETIRTDLFGRVASVTAIGLVLPRAAG